MKCAGGEGMGPQPDPAEHQADGEKYRQRRPGVGQLIGVDQGEGDAGDGAGNQQEPQCSSGDRIATPRSEAVRFTCLTDA